LIVIFKHGFIDFHIEEFRMYLKFMLNFAILKYS